MCAAYLGQLHGGHANATVATVSFCDLLILTAEDFDEVLLDFLQKAPQAMSHDIRKGSVSDLTA